MTWEDWNLAALFDWCEVVVGSERYFKSARADESIGYLDDTYGVAAEAFIGRHIERATSKRYEPDVRELAPRRPMDDPHPGVVTVTHLEKLSWMDCDLMRLIVVDTCERRLVMEARDLQTLLQRPAVPAVTLRLWREASQLPAASASIAVRLLLDELERWSIRGLFMENEVELGKFF